MPPEETPPHADPRICARPTERLSSDRRGAFTVTVLIAPATKPAAGAGLTLPPQGIYESCAPGTDGDACITHLTEIRAAGFRYVLNYSAWYGSAAEVVR